ncbi:MAG: ABC transporter ATP-binding protein/permease [Betaproteobacteria bacterium]|nr:ABC transporter ATP-binding protein/permease [Betaproteobacteria bacterium]
MNKARASSQVAATSPVAGPAVKSTIHGTDTIVPSLDGDYLRGVNALWRVLRMALGYRVRFPAAVLAVIGAGVFQLLIPRFLGRAVDHATGLLAGAHGVGASEAAQAALMTSALLVLGTAVVRGLFTLAHNYLAESIGQSFGYELRLAFFEKLQRLSFSYHDRIHSGDLITRGMLDIEGVRRFIETGIMRLFQLAVLVGLGAYLYMGQDLLLGFLCVSFVPFAVWRGTVFRLKVRALWREFQERMSVLTRIMEENLAGIRVVRAFSAQQHELDKFDDWQRRTLEPAVESVRVRYFNTSMMTFAYFLAMGLVLWLGSLRVIGGQITIGELTQFLVFMTVLQMPVRQVGLVINGFARASVSGARMFEILDIEPAIRDQPGARDLAVNMAELAFENVSFSYGGFSGEHAVADISFTVSAGRTLGIVGPPGSGKSTIAHLIPRFYDVTGGRITIDGQDIREVTLDSLRAQVGVVQQDTFLFKTEVRENVAYGDPTAEDDRVVDAADTAQLHDYVAGLPDGYDTLVGERGVSLSGGQRQRLSIARSVLLAPRVIVFDDSTAAIDADTELRIRDALKALNRSRATIIVSHRLSSLMHADEILFLDAGRIVERGSHGELLAQGGRYRRLFDLQMGVARQNADA